MATRLSPTLAEAKLRACEMLWARGGVLAAEGGVEGVMRAIEAVRGARSLAAVRTVMREAAGGGKAGAAGVVGPGDESGATG